MISFKEFLTESRSAPLYHATTAASAEKILKDNVLYGTVQEQGQTTGQKVIFVTRSLRQAKHYIKFDSKVQDGVILVLDQLKLTYRHKIQPIKNWDRERADYAWDDNRVANAKRIHKPMYMVGTHGANEFEEIIKADKVQNISSYITKILINTNPDKYPNIKAMDNVEVI